MRRRPAPNRLTTGERNGLIEAHAWLAHSIAARASSRRATRDELLSAAWEGLVVAARYYDPDKGHKFSTYATYWVRNSVRREATAGLIRGDDGREFRSEECRRLASRANRIGSIHGCDVESPPDDGGDPGWADRASAEDAIEAAIGRLPDRLRTVMSRLRCGDHRREIGDGLGVTKQRVRQLEQRAIELLRADIAGEPAPPPPTRGRGRPRKDWAASLADRP